MKATIASVWWATGSTCIGMNQSANPTSGPNTEPILMRGESSANSSGGGAATPILTSAMSAIFAIENPSWTVRRLGLQGLQKRPPQKYLDKMSFVFRRALLVIDQFGRVRERFSGQGQIAFDLGAGAGQQAFRRRRAPRARTDAAHGHSRAAERFAVVRRLQCQRQPQHRPLVNLELDVSRSPPPG